MRVQFSILLLFFLVPAYGQPVDSVRMIYDILAMNDTSTMYSKSLVLRENGLYFENEKQRFIPPLRKYIKKHPNKRVEILSKLFINMIYSYEDVRKVDLQEVEKMIKQAMILDDKRISADVYWLAGRIYDSLEDYERAITYFYASAKCFDEIPHKRFTTADYIDYEVAQLLYKTKNYRGTIEFGLKCYSDIDDPRSVYKKMRRITLLDILGAAYKKIKMPDSSLFYYNEMLLFLDNNQDLFTDREIELWSYVAKGNIGENYFNLDRIEEAEPLIITYYEGSMRLKDTLNIMLSQNVYAQLLSAKGEKRKAIKLWKSVIENLSIDPGDALRETVYDNLAKAFKDVEVIDSAFYYYDSFSIIKAKSEKAELIYGLNRIKQEYSFNELSSRSIHLRNRIVYLKKLRIYTIVIIALISSITILLIYLKRKSLRQELLTQKYKGMMSMRDLNMTKEKTQDLKSKLLETNYLSTRLIQKIRALETSEDKSSLINQIKEYTLTTEEGWLDFRTKFLKTYPHFLYNLHESRPSVSPAEQRILFLLYLKMSNKEIARLLGISAASVSKSKYRLKQSLEFDSIEELEEFIATL